MFVEVKHLQLKAVSIHKDVTDRYLRQVTLRAEKEKAQFEQDEKVLIVLFHGSRDNWEPDVSTLQASEMERVGQG